MNDTHKNILEENLNELFGFEAMSEEEKSALLDDVGSTVLESALLRFSVEHSGNPMDKLEELIEKNEDSEDVFEHVLEKVPEFEKILKEEIIAFKEEAKAVLL